MGRCLDIIPVSTYMVTLYKTAVVQQAYNADEMYTILLYCPKKDIISQHSATHTRIYPPNSANLCIPNAMKKKRIWTFIRHVPHHPSYTRFPSKW